MDEEYEEYPAELWDAGFEGGRYLVQTRLGIFSRVFERPQYFKKRLWHTVFELPIREWKISLNPLKFGSLCVVLSELLIRYQPSFQYAKQHLEHLSNIGAQIEQTLGPLLQDIAEGEIRKMETQSDWLEEGCAKMERNIGLLINEMLVMRGIHCRSLCRIEPQFAAIDALDLNTLPLWQHQQKIYEEYLRRRREAKERLLREQTQDITKERVLMLEREQIILELAKSEGLQKQAVQAQQLAELQEEFRANEAQIQVQIESQNRLLAEELAHETKKREMTVEQVRIKSETELDAQREIFKLERIRLTELHENELLKLEEQLILEVKLQEKQKQSIYQAQINETEKQQLELESKGKMLAEALASKTRLQEEKIRHEQISKEKQTQAERSALEFDLNNQKALLEFQLLQQNEKQKYELKLKEDELLYENWLRQMKIEAEITAKEAEAEARRKSEETTLARQLEYELAQNETKLATEKRLRQQELAHSTEILELQSSAALRNKQLELDKLQAQIESVNTQLAKQRDAEAIIQEEQLRHEVRLRQLQFDLDLKAKENRTPELAELETYLDTEISLLALERQRIKLEEEIRQAKLSRTQEFIHNASFPASEYLDQVTTLDNSSRS